MHTLARPAHEAARCAGAAGKYWAYHDRLFEAQPAFRRADLLAYAGELGLDCDAFGRCLDERRFAADVERDIEQAQALGIRSTPTFLINGQRVICATSPTCPHEDGPLAEGWLEGDAVICPWHGYDFALATGACRVAPGLTVAVYPVRVNGTAVEIDLS